MAIAEVVEQGPDLAISARGSLFKKGTDSGEDRDTTQYKSRKTIAECSCRPYRLARIGC